VRVIGARLSNDNPCVLRPLSAVRTRHIHLRSFSFLQPPKCCTQVQTNYNIKCNTSVQNPRNGHRRLRRHPTLHSCRMDPASPICIGFHRYHLNMRIFFMRAAFFRFYSLRWHNLWRDFRDTAAGFCRFGNKHDRTERGPNGLKLVRMVGKGGESFGKTQTIEFMKEWKLDEVRHLLRVADTFLRNSTTPDKDAVFRFEKQNIARICSASKLFRGFVPEKKIPFLNKRPSNSSHSFQYPCVLLYIFFYFFICHPLPAARLSIFPQYLLHFFYLNIFMDKKIKIF
jgi:hypothetical protein